MIFLTQLICVFSKNIGSLLINFTKFIVSIVTFSLLVLVVWIVPCYMLVVLLVVVLFFTGRVFLCASFSFLMFSVYMPYGNQASSFTDNLNTLGEIHRGVGSGGAAGAAAPLKYL